jgi:hypothetical protein
MFTHDIRTKENIGRIYNCDGTMLTLRRGKQEGENVCAIPPAKEKVASRLR